MSRQDWRNQNGEIVSNIENFWSGLEDDFRTFLVGAGAC